MSLDFILHILHLFSFLFFLIFFWSYVIVFVPFFVFFTSIHSVALMTQLSQDVWLVFFIFLCTWFLTLRFLPCFENCLCKTLKLWGRVYWFCLHREEESPIKSDLDAFSYLPRLLQKVVGFSTRNEFAF